MHYVDFVTYSYSFKYVYSDNAICTLLCHTEEGNNLVQPYGLTGHTINMKSFADVWNEIIIVTSSYDIMQTGMGNSRCWLHIYSLTDGDLFITHAEEHINFTKSYFADSSVHFYAVCTVIQI